MAKRINYPEQIARLMTITQAQLAPSAYQECRALLVSLNQELDAAQEAAQWWTDKYYNLKTQLTACNRALDGAENPRQHLRLALQTLLADLEDLDKHLATDVTGAERDAPYPYLDAPTPSKREPRL